MLDANVAMTWKPLGNDDVDIGYINLDDGPRKKEIRIPLRLGLSSVPFILLLGLGGHASKNALAPAEPALHDMGLSPIAYAVLAASPIFGAIAMPPIWGAWFAQRERLVLLLVPLGVLVGQTLITIGMALNERHAPLLLVAVVMIVGFVIYSLSRAGVGVIQHSALARALPIGITAGFVGIIAATHLTKAACQFMVPKLLDADGLQGLLWALLVPSLVSVLAGYQLGKGQDDDDDAINSNNVPQRQVSPFQEARPSIGRCCMISSFSNALTEGRLAIGLLAMWRALTVGMLHAFESVTNSLLVSEGLSSEAAGSVLGLAQSSTLVTLLLVGALGDLIGRRVLLVLTSVLCLGSSVCLLLGNASGELPAGLMSKASLFALATAGIMGPVLPLTLVPSNAKSSEVAFVYGLMDSLFSLSECSFIWIIGVLREYGHGDFHDVLLFVCSGFAAAMIVVFAVVIYCNDDTAQKRELPSVR